MLPQALQLIPFIAIASAISLGVTIGIICYRQGYRRTGFGVSSRQSILSIFQKLWSAVIPTQPSRLDLLVHDPGSAKPHDLDDPFFDRKVQERVGAAIAKAALKRAKP
jgi:hypothetical protein